MVGSGSIAQLSRRRQEGEKLAARRAERERAAIQRAVERRARHGRDESPVPTQGDLICFKVAVRPC
jgi:hypothetical protein